MRYDPIITIEPDRTEAELAKLERSRRRKRLRNRALRWLSLLVPFALLNQCAELGKGVNAFRPGDVPAAGRSSPKD